MLSTYNADTPNLVTSRPFVVVDPETGQRVKFSTKDTIIENFKKKDIANNEVLNTNISLKDSNNIFKFY